jgi:hypothetical protein
MLKVYQPNYEIRGDILVMAPALRSSAVASSQQISSYTNVVFI